MFESKVAEKIKTHFLFSNFFKNRDVYKIMLKKYFRAGQET